MNLVLSDNLSGEETVRINLTNHGDGGWTREAGLWVADFLGVPLLEGLAGAGTRRGA